MATEEGLVIEIARAPPADSLAQNLLRMAVAAMIAVAALATVAPVAVVFVVAA